MSINILTVTYILPTVMISMTKQKQEDYQNENIRPISSKKFINDRQVLALADFIIENFKNKELTKEYCENFFKKGSKVCEGLQQTDINI